MNEYISDETVNHGSDFDTIPYVEPVRERSKLATLHRLEAKKKGIQTLRRKQSKPEIEIVRTVLAPIKKKNTGEYRKWAKDVMATGKKLMHFRDRK